MRKEQWVEWPGCGAPNGVQSEEGLCLRPEKIFGIFEKKSMVLCIFIVKKLCLWPETGNECGGLIDSRGLKV